MAPTSFHERIIEGQRKSAQLAGLPTPESVIAADEEALARTQKKEAEESEKRSAALAASTGLPPNLGVRNVVCSETVGQQEQVETAPRGELDDTFAEQVEEFRQLDGRELWVQVNAMGCTLREELDDTFATRSKRKGDPLPFVGSHVTKDGFWEAYSDSESDDSHANDTHAGPSRTISVGKVSKYVLRVVNNYEEDTRVVLEDWTAKCFAMRNLLLQVSNSAAQWKKSALDADQQCRAAARAHHEANIRLEEEQALREEKTSMLIEQKKSALENLMELKREIVHLKTCADKNYVPAISCKFCQKYCHSNESQHVAFPDGTLLHEEGQMASHIDEHGCASRACRGTREELQREVEDLRGRLKKTQAEHEALLDEVRTQSQRLRADGDTREAQQRDQSAQIAILQGRLDEEAEARRRERAEHQQQVLELEEMLKKRIATMDERDRKRDEEYAANEASAAARLEDTEARYALLLEESEMRERQAGVQASILEKSVEASDQINSDLMAELESIRSELSDSMDDILKTRHIVTAVEQGTGDITPWRTPASRPRSASAHSVSLFSDAAPSSAKDDDVLWMNPDSSETMMNPHVYMPAAGPDTHAVVDDTLQRPDSATLRRAKSRRPCSANPKRGASAQAVGGDKSAGNGIQQQPHRARPASASATHRHGVQARRSRPSSATPSQRPADKPLQRPASAMERQRPSSTLQRPSSAIERSTPLQTAVSAGGAGRPASAMLRRDDAAGWGTSKDSATNLVDGSSATHVVHSDAAVIDVQDLHVMDRLLLRGQQLNQKVQRKAAEFAMRRHDELQRVLSTNEWETGASTKDCAGPNRSRRRSVPS